MNKRPAMKRKLPAYEKGGLVTKPKAPPTPMDIDQLSALPPGKRKPYEKKAEKQTMRDYPPARKK